MKVILHIEYSQIIHGWFRKILLTHELLIFVTPFAEYKTAGWRGARMVLSKSNVIGIVGRGIDLDK